MITDLRVKTMNKDIKMSVFKLFMYIGYGHAVYDMAPDYLKRVRDFLIG